MRSFASAIAFGAALISAITAMAPFGAAAAPPLTGVASISVGSYHTCARMAAGGAKCWGNNTFGQAGIDTPQYDAAGPRYQALAPVDVTGLASGVASVSAGAYHTCALMTSGAAKCWGYNPWGQLGDGTSDLSRFAPVDVAALQKSVAAIDAGQAHTCAVTNAGAVECWGYNADYRLGDGNTIAHATPVTVIGLSSGARAVSAASTSCAITALGGAKCWGGGAQMPVDVAGLTTGVAAITHRCALTTSGGVKCWGRNDAGQVGDGTTIDRPTPVDVAGLTSGVAAISAAERHACALTTQGAVKCWGQTDDGTLDAIVTFSSPVPVDVSGLEAGVLGVSAGDSHSCAVMAANGEARCWGANQNGQLGDGTAGPPRMVPAAVASYSFQTIAFARPDNRGPAESPFTIAPVASSGLPVVAESRTPAVCTVSGYQVTLLTLGICTIAVNQAGNAVYLAAPEIARSFVVRDPIAALQPRFSNLSTRARVGLGDDVTIGGFVIGGTAGKTVVVRGRGPSLAGSGVADALADPIVRIYSGQNVVPVEFAHDIFGGTPVTLGLGPLDPAEWSVIATLQPGAYTAILSSLSGTRTGVGIVEMFEIDNPGEPLVNIATRGRVGIGEDVMIAGFVIEGNGPQAVVVRARGPSLAASGLANVLADPVLQLFSGQTQIAANDSWGDASNAAEIAASGFAPSDARESAILMTLPPGAYTAIVRGAATTSGTAIVEVFRR